MDQLYFKILKTAEESILVEEWRLPYFYSRVHFHPEYQLTFIHNSSGSLFIGDKLEAFQPGDIFIIGSNVPHVFINNENDLIPKDNSVNAISIFFTKSSFGNGFLDLPELKQIRDMLQKAEFGVKTEGSCRKRVAVQLASISQLPKFDRLITLLSALQTIAASDEIMLISSSSIPLVFERNESNKIDLVYEYTLKNFAHKITLKEVADLMNMTPTSFCKFFKLHTRKTYVEFLIGIRISNACRQLVSGRKNVSEIAYSCGFTNLSNFTRQFKTMIGLSPREYRKTIYKQYKDGAEDIYTRLAERRLDLPPEQFK